MAYQVVIIPFPTAALAIMPVRCMGWWGDVLVVVSLNAASWLSFGFKFFGRHFVRESHGKWVKRFDEWMQEDGFAPFLLRACCTFRLIRGSSRRAFYAFVPTVAIASLRNVTVHGIVRGARRCIYGSGGVVFIWRFGGRHAAAALFSMRSRWAKRILSFASVSDGYALIYSIFFRGAPASERRCVCLPHGNLQTPFFMPIAAKGAVKTLSSCVERWISCSAVAYHL